MTEVARCSSCMSISNIETANIYWLNQGVECLLKRKQDEGTLLDTTYMQDRDFDCIEHILDKHFLNHPKFHEHKVKYDTVAINSRGYTDILQGLGSGYVIMNGKYKLNENNITVYPTHYDPFFIVQIQPIKVQINMQCDLIELKLEVMKETILIVESTISHATNALTSSSWPSCNSIARIFSVSHKNTLNRQLGKAIMRNDDSMSYKTAMHIIGRS